MRAGIWDTYFFVWLIKSRNKRSTLPLMTEIPIKNDRTLFFLSDVFIWNILYAFDHRRCATTNIYESKNEKEVRWKKPFKRTKTILKFHPLLKYNYFYMDLNDITTISSFDKSVLLLLHDVTPVDWISLFWMNPESESEFHMILKVGPFLSLH